MFKTNTIVLITMKEYNWYGTLAKIKKGLIERSQKVGYDVEIVSGYRTSYSDTYYFHEEHLKLLSNTMRLLYV